MPRRTDLKARPVEVDYRKNLEDRQPRGRGEMLIEMDYVGIGGTVATKPYKVQDGIAMIPIAGVLVNDACWWDETQYSWIQEDVKIALEDPQVKGILLSIASPGGETDNAFETADMLAQAGKKKPLWAAADPYAFSAAYLLGSQAEQFYMPPITGGVGSIGVYMLHMDYSKRLEDMGVKPTFISAGKGKTDGNPYQPLSEDAFKRMKAEVDRLYAEFVSRVASGRNLSESAIIKLGAVTFEGSKAALGAGLIDRVGSSETAWLEMGAQVASRRNGMAAAAVPNQPKGVSMNPQGAPEPQPAQAAAPPVDLVKLRADATSEGYSAAAEVIELCTLCKVAPATIATYIREKKPVADIRKELLAAMAKKSAEPGEIDNSVEHHANAGAEKPKERLVERMAKKLKGEGRIK